MELAAFDDLAFCDLAVALYDKKRWGEFDYVNEVAGVCFAVKKLSDRNVLLYRGSITPLDWVRDFEALPEVMKLHPQLGFVHSGMAQGMDEALADAIAHSDLDQPFHPGGHSLGGGRAALATGLLINEGYFVIRSTLFGCHNSGTARLRKLVSSRPGASYRNRQDPVPLLPTVPPFAHPRDWTPLDAAPDVNPTDPFNDHNIKLYRAGLAKLPRRV